MTGLVTAIYDIGCACGAVGAFIFGERIGRKKSVMLAQVISTSAAYSTQPRLIGLSHCWSDNTNRFVQLCSDVRAPYDLVDYKLTQTKDGVPRYCWVRSWAFYSRSPHSRSGDVTASKPRRPSSYPIRFDYRWCCACVLGVLCYTECPELDAMAFPCKTACTAICESKCLRSFQIACQVIFSITILVLCPFLPESPRWLAQRGELDNARKTISRLINKPEDHSAVKGQLNEILEAIRLETAESEPTWYEVFSNSTPSRNLHRVLLGVGPFMYNQWSGINSLC